MKNKFLHYFIILLVFLYGITLVGCGSIPNDPVDYNNDLKEVSPENIDLDHFIIEEGKTYYTSPGMSLWMEVNGEFLEMDYFYVENDLRVYDNLYFYVDDYFYMLTEDLKYLYASLGDSTDLEYAEEEKQSGEDIQINIKKAGIYKLTFDVKTFKFDLEFKEEIQNPVYYSIKNCSIYSLATSWVEMSKNPNNPDEFFIKDYTVEAGKVISFFNNIHISNYKVTLEESINNKLAMVRKTDVTVNIGGNYNVYINKNTYVVRLELTNPETAVYSCIYYDGTDFIELEPVGDAPYIFHQRVEVTTDLTTDLPDFHSKGYRTYDLTVVDTDNVLIGSGKNCYFKKKGTYDVIVNLKTFEITAILLPE